MGFFSPFPHGTGSLSVNREYLALEDGPPIFSQHITCADLLFVTPFNRTFMYRAITVYGYTFQSLPLERKNSLLLGCSTFARRYLRNLG
jgi:hypothetical protein